MFPYGEEYTTTTQDTDKFGTYFRDSTTALDYARNRYYSNRLARFLNSSWIPALAGVEAKLKNGARVADVGCGHGASTILLPKA